MEPEKITLIKCEIGSLMAKNIKNIDISVRFLRDTIEESREFLSRDPLDVLTPNFDRDKARLEEYLNVKLEITPHGSFQVFPIS